MTHPENVMAGRYIAVVGHWVKNGQLGDEQHRLAGEVYYVRGVDYPYIYLECVSRKEIPVQALDTREAFIVRVEPTDVEALMLELAEAKRGRRKRRATKKGRFTEGG